MREEERGEERRGERTGERIGEERRGGEGKEESSLSLSLSRCGFLLLCCI